MKNYKQKIVWSIVASVVIYLGFSIYADLDKVAHALAGFSF